VFAPNEPFQPSLMLANKAEAYPSGAPSRCSLLGYAPSLTENINYVAKT